MPVWFDSKMVAVPGETCCSSCCRPILQVKPLTNLEMSTQVGDESNGLFVNATCTEAAALKAIENLGRSELKLISLPERALLQSPMDELNDEF